MAFDPVSITLAVIAVISAGASYVQAKKAQKKAKELTEGVEANIESNSKEIPVVYGKRRVGGVRVYIDTSRDKKHQYLYMVLAMAEGEVESITDIKIDDISIEDDRFNYDGLLSERNLEFEVYLGSDGQEASTLIGNGVSYDYDRLGEIYNDPFADQHERDAADPNRVLPWSSKHKLSGIAYLALKFKWDEGAYTGIPDVTAVVKGRKVYDPRTSTTAWSDNPALCIRDYLTNERFGKGLPASAIDDVAFSQAANDLDSFIAYPYQDSPEYQYLFRMNHVVDTSKKIMENLNDMIIACRGFIPYSNGVYSLKIDQTSSSVLDIGPDQIISGIAVAGARKEDRFNQVKVNFFNASSNYKEDQAIYPEQNSTLYQQYLTEDEGEPLVDEIDLYSIDNYYSAREMARLFLERSRQNMTIAFQGTSELINLEVGEVVSITHPTPAWTNKLFQVQEVSLAFDGTVQITCIEYDAALYTYDTPEEEQPYVGTRLPDPNQVDPISNLEITSGSYIENDGKTIGYLDIDWDTPDDALVDRYELEISYSSKSEIIEIASESYRFKPTQDGVSYTVSVRSVNGLGIRSNWVEATAISSSIDTTAPSDPSSFSITGGFKEITLGWTNPADNDFDLVTIKRADDAQGTNEIVIASIRSNSYTDSGLGSQQTKHYWIKASDRTGNETDYVYMGSGTTEFITTSDFQSGITVDFLGQDAQDLIASKAPQSDVNLIIDEVQSNDDKLDTVAERMLLLATRQDEFTGLMRDAGITVDPDNGSITLQAVEALRSETESSLNQVDIELDAQSASINLKASTAYVNNAIANAVLDSADLASLNDLELKVNQAEIDIDANEAAILLKADSTTVTGLDVRLSQAEIDIDGAEAAILLKADTTDFTALEDRVTTAEIDIGALDQASITQTVIDSRANTKAIDKSAITNLRDVLNQYRDRETTKVDLAFTRTQIFADVNEQREALARQKTELGSLIDDNKASIISESQTRADEDSALSFRIDTLNATTGANSANITQINFVSADSESAIARQVSSISTQQSVDAGLISQAITDASNAQDTADGKVTTFYQDEQPTADGTGDLWVDTNDKNKLYRWDGSSWVEIRDTDIAQAIQDASTAQETADGKIVSYYQAAEPTEGSDGDLWVDTDDKNTLYRHNGTQWVSIRDTDIGEALTRANAAQDTADGKIVTFFQDDEPTGDFGDLWVDTNDGNKLYRFSRVDVEDPEEGEPTFVDEWVIVRDAGIQQALDNASTAQTTADGKIVSFYQDEEPTTASEGDLWIDTNDGNKLYIYSSSSWVSARDADFVTASTTIQTVSDTVDGIKGQYGLSINNNGSISGFGLVSELIDDEVVSAFNVAADKFSLTSSITGAVWDNTENYTTGDIVYYLGLEYTALRDNSNKEPDTNDQDWENTTKTPFVVYTTDTDVVIDGTTVTFPAGVYIDNAFIGKLSANDIAVGTLKADRISLNGNMLEANASGQIQIADGGVQSDQIDNSAVITDKINDNAVSDNETAFTASSQIISDSETLIQTVSSTGDFDSNNLVTVSFPLLSPIAMQYDIVIKKSYTFGSPPTPVTTDVISLTNLNYQQGNNLVSYSYLDNHLGIQNSPVYKLYVRKVQTNSYNPVASNVFMSVTEIKK